MRYNLSELWIRHHWVISFILLMIVWGSCWLCAHISFPITMFIGTALPWLVLLLFTLGIWTDRHNYDPTDPTTHLQLKWIITYIVVTYLVWMAGLILFVMLVGPHIKVGFG